MAAVSNKFRSLKFPTWKEAVQLASRLCRNQSVQVVRMTLTLLLLSVLSGISAKQGSPVTRGGKLGTESPIPNLLILLRCTAPPMPGGGTGSMRWGRPARSQTVLGCLVSLRPCATNCWTLLLNLSNSGAPVLLVRCPAGHGPLAANLFGGSDHAVFRLSIVCVSLSLSLPPSLFVSIHRSHCRFRCHIFLLQSGAALGALKKFKVPHPELFGPGPGKKQAG